jgi:hypothetical protein
MLFSTSHPSPLPPPTHLPTTWTPSSRPVLRFARLVHPTPLLLQVLRSLSPRHTRPRCPSPQHARPRRPRPRHAQHWINASPSPPWCTSDDIRHPRRSPLAPGRRSTTPSPWLVTLAAHTRWSLVVLPRSPSPWIIYNSPPPPLPRHCLQSRPLFVARSRTPTGVAL